MTRAPADDPDGPPFRYHWQAIHKVFKPVHGESYSVWLCADLETLAINVRMEVMAIFRTERSQRNRPKQSRFLIWDIEQAKVRHEYLIAEDYREQTTFVTFPLGGSPDGSIVVFRAAQALTSDPAEEIGVFITRTSEPWGAVFVKTPMVVHDVAWTDAGRATLVLSNRTAASNERWVRPVEAAPGVPTLDVDAALASEAVHDLP